MKEFKKGQTYFIAYEDGSVGTSVWDGGIIDAILVQRGCAFHTWGDAEARAEELNRTSKEAEELNLADKAEPKYPKKMLVWDSDSDPYGKLERTVLGTLRGRYMTVEDFGTVLEAAGSAGAATVSFYRHAEDIPETLEDYLAEIELPEGAAEKIVELAKKMKL
jgi:hypothetical protein